MKKMDILNRLVKDGAISLDEALILLEPEIKIVEKVIVKEVSTKPVDWPPIKPFEPYKPLPNPYTTKPNDPYKPFWLAEIGKKVLAEKQHADRFRTWTN